MARYLLRLFVFAGAMMLNAIPALAGGGGHVGFGLSFGFPLFFYGPPAYYAPPPPYYAPPPVVYAPAPTLYATPASPPYVGSSGASCQQFQSFGLINGRRERIYGTACQQPDGSWRVVR